MSDYPKLSTTSGNPIAKIVKNRKYKMLYLQTEEPSDSESSDYSVDEYDIYSEDELMKDYGKKYNLKSGKSKSCRVDYMTPSKKKEAKALKYREFHIKAGFLEPMPDFSLDRDMIFVAAPSGSGKSTYVAMYLSNYKKAFPKNKIYVFSKLTHDEAFNKIKPNYVPITIENFVEDPIEIEELSNSCCVFDDIDTITDKVLRNAVLALRDRCLEIGRHEKISVCVTSHQLMNYSLTRTVINEAQSVTVFPRSGSSYHIKTFLTKYAGMNKEQVERVLNLPSRWVTIHKNYPLYVMYNQGCYLV